jgi:hypothetical protein
MPDRVRAAISTTDLGDPGAAFTDNRTHMLLLLALTRRPGHWVLATHHPA